MYDMIKEKKYIETYKKICFKSLFKKKKKNFFNFTKQFSILFQNCGFGA